MIMLLITIQQKGGDKHTAVESKPGQGMKFWPRLSRIGVLPPPFRVGNRGRPSNHDRKKGLNESSTNKNKLSRDKRIMTCSTCRDRRS